jgi:hypothetical protein
MARSFVYEPEVRAKEHLRLLSGKAMLLRRPYQIYLTKSPKVIRTIHLIEESKWDEGDDSEFADFQVGEVNFFQRFAVPHVSR